MPAGSLVGSLAVTQLADKLGRKKTIILAGLIWVIGSILQCASVVRSDYEPCDDREMLI
jgi:MFS family permease